MGQLRLWARVFGVIHATALGSVGCTSESAEVAPGGPSAEADGGTSVTDSGASVADGVSVTDGANGVDSGQQGDSGSGSSVSGQLKILSLTATSPTLTGGKPAPTESSTTTFVAIVTDTKGLDTIAGGQLKDPDGHTYGAFGAGSTKGTYTVTVDWTSVNSTFPIDFGGTGGELPGRARGHAVLDNHEGHAGERDGPRCVLHVRSVSGVRKRPESPIPVIARASASAAPGAPRS